MVLCKKCIEKGTILNCDRCGTGIIPEKGRVMIIDLSDSDAILAMIGGAVMGALVMFVFMGLI